MSNYIDMIEKLGTEAEGYEAKAKKIRAAMLALAALEVETRNPKRRGKDRTPRARAAQSKIDAVYATVALGGQFDANEVSSRTGIKHTGVYLAQLAKRGRIVRVGVGQYTLPTPPPVPAINHEPVAVN